jgi:iron complex outermembrane receptor protein
MTVGGGYRLSDDHVGNSAFLAFLPAHRTMQWGNLFAQQEWILQPELRFTTGLRLEYNPFTHVDFLPSLKLAWAPADDKLLWAGLSRAVRAPSRIDTDFYLTLPEGTLAGGPDFRSEIANTLSLGWRAQTGDTLSYSMTAFYSRYDHLRSIKATSSSTSVLANEIKGWVNGIEGWAGYQLTNNWSFDAGALVQKEHFKGDNLAISSPGNDSPMQFNLRSKWNVNANQELDIFLRHVGKLPKPVIRAYTAVDARYGWRFSTSTELALTGRNLFDPRHKEFASSSNSSAGSQIARSIDLSLTARF